jgi:hypothetical protein
MEGSLLKCENKDRSGFIFNYSDRIRKQISVSEFEKFSKLPSDEARIEFICNYTGDKPIEATTSVSRNKKDLQLANNLKKVGNNHFQNSQWRDALNYYGQSLIQTPKENGRLVHFVCDVTRNMENGWCKIVIIEKYVVVSFS